jgi:cbb3-type cytochrome oxidase maturation protein
MGLYLLIPLSVVLVFIIGVIFWWSVRSGQFDDMEGPAYRMLIDDRDPEVKRESNKEAVTDAAATDESVGSEPPAAPDEASSEQQAGARDELTRG